ncbi:MAG: hypothetical protein Faunusvirus13_18 [Faunusvirus sp.]|uniref:Uncharacterized protein n=1 Tax=Faunusvirus sp. TaxID=2487766 RepID=A0A3G4ZX04_9VIRU|nr:MAG: hypothetical protein Faunusvirus13_18 [Faunusvirus sp.]
MSKKSKCVEIKDKKYQTRNSPPYHAKDCLNKCISIY